MERAGTLFLVDRDSLSRCEMASALRTLGWQVQTFAKLGDYLRGFDPEAPGCVLLKDFLDADSHRQLQERKRAGRSLQPVIYVPDDFNVSTTIDVFKAFTVLLRNPLGLPEFRAASGELRLDRPHPPPADQLFPSDELLTTTSTTERQVLSMTCAGRPIKQIQTALSMKKRTFQRLKSALYERLRIDSPAELVRINDRLASLALPSPEVASPSSRS